MSANSLAANNIAIVAYGETKIVRKTDQSESDMAAAVLLQVLEKSGLERDAIDGLATTFGPGERFWSNTLADNLGLTLRWTQLTDLGGASSIANVQRAAMAIQSGQCSMVFCVASSIGGPPAAVADHQAEFQDPFGYRGPPTAFGLLSKFYDDKYGLNSKALGKLAVAQRNGAILNENACESLRKPLSLDDYLNSRMIAEPLRLLDCVMPCAGANGVLVTSTENARALGLEKMVHPTAYAEVTNFMADDPLADPTVTGFSLVGPEAVKKAGLTPADIDMLQAYDDFLIAVQIQLEEIGFCPRGQGGKFLLNTDISPTGTLPINTGGGQISAGQPALAGGGINLVEAVRQLFQDAGARQVPDPRNALVTGIGVIPYVRNWGTSAVLILETAQ